MTGRGLNYASIEKPRNKYHTWHKVKRICKDCNKEIKGKKRNSKYCYYCITLRDRKSRSESAKRSREHGAKYREMIKLYKDPKNDICPLCKGVK